MFPVVRTPVEQFEIIARDYSLNKLRGEAHGNLTAIGKELGIEPQQLQAIRLRAMAWAKRRPQQPSADDKEWIWPSPKEEREHSQAA